MADLSRPDARRGASAKPGRIRLFGPPLATWGGTHMLLSDRMFAAVAYLALQPGHTARREAVRAIAFGDEDAVRSNNSFRQALSRTRRVQGALGAELLSIEGDSLSLHTDRFTLDLIDFEERAGSVALSRGDAKALRAFLDLYTGDLLEGSRVAGEAFEAWLAAQRSRSADRFLRVAHRALEDGAGLADDDLIDLARRVAAIQPESPAACVASVRAHARRHGKAAARRVFDAHLALMVHEFDGAVDPQVLAVGAALGFSAGVPAARAPATAPAAATRPSDPAPTAAPDPERRGSAQPALGGGRGCPRILILPPITALAETATRLADAFIEDVTVSLARHRSFTIMAHHTARTLSADPAAARLPGPMADFTIATALKPTSRGVAMTFRVNDVTSGEVVSASEIDWHHDDLDRAFTHLVGRVARFIADAVESRALRLSPAAKDVSAYRLYLEGRQSLRSIDLPHLRRAKRWFRDATNRCPDYAAPLFGLARATIMEWLIVGMPNDASLGDAVALADRGLQHDPFDWKGLREKALASLWLRRHDACLELFERAMLLGPNDADLIADYADALAHCGEPERGLDLHARAVELNPLHPDYYAWIKGSILFQSGRYEESLETLEPIRHNPATSRLLAACSAAAGRSAEARTYARTLREVYPDFRADDLWRVSPNRRSQDTAHFVQALRLAGVD